MDDNNLIDVIEDTDKEGNLLPQLKSEPLDKIELFKSQVYFGAMILIYSNIALYNLHDIIKTLKQKGLYRQSIKYNLKRVLKSLDKITHSSFAIIEDKGLTMSEMINLIDRRLVESKPNDISIEDYQEQLLTICYTKLKGLQNEYVEFRSIYYTHINLVYSILYDIIYSMGRDDIINIFDSIIREIVFNVDAEGHIIISHNEN